jgi:hypothetical protein
LAAEGEPDPTQPFTPSADFQELITKLAREQLPDKYEKTKNWGKTTRVFDGWKLERDGLRLAQAIADTGQLPIAGPEIMTPLRNAVGLIHDEEAGPDALAPKRPAQALEAFG